MGEIDFFFYVNHDSSTRMSSSLLRSKRLTLMKHCIYVSWNWRTYIGSKQGSNNFLWLTLLAVVIDVVRCTRHQACIWLGIASSTWVIFLSISFYLVKLPETDNPRNQKNFQTKKKSRKNLSNRESNREPNPGQMSCPLTPRVQCTLTHLHPHLLDFKPIYSNFLPKIWPF